MFPEKPGKGAVSTLLLCARIFFGCAFMTHGMQKWNDFPTLAQTFPDPLGIGSQTSLALAVFAELLCPLALIFGFLFRLALVPMIFTMLMAFFIIHGADPFSIRELSFLYLGIFILLSITGPGCFSIDWLIGKNLNKRRRPFSSFTSSGLDYSR